MLHIHTQSSLLMQQQRRQQQQQGRCISLFVFLSTSYSWLSDPAHAFIIPAGSSKSRIFLQHKPFSPSSSSSSPNGGGRSASITKLYLSHEGVSWQQQQRSRRRSHTAMMVSTYGQAPIDEPWQSNDDEGDFFTSHNPASLQK